MKIGAYETHPAADIFPLLEGAEFAALVADIREHGLREWIWLFDGVILDGRNRLRACHEACIKPQFREYTGDDPVAFVLSHNLHRRHLSESQRGMVAARIANLPNGTNRHSLASPIGEATKQADAAALLKVGRGTVTRARAVITHGVPEVVAAVESGDMAVSAAERLSRMPAATQREIMKEADGDGRKVLDLAREAGGKAPPSRAKDAPDAPPAPPAAKPNQRSAAVAAFDAQVKALWDGGARRNVDFCKALGVSPNTITDSMQRLGFAKRLHAIQSIEKRARENAEDLASLLRQPEIFKGADAEEIAQCIKSLRALSGAAKSVSSYLEGKQS